MNTTQNAHESFLKGIRTATHVLPELEEKTIDGHPILLQTGFQMAELHKQEAATQLSIKLQDWSTRQTEDENYIHRSIAAYTKQYADIIHSNEQNISTQEQKLNDINKEKEALKTDIKALEDKLSGLQKKKNEALQEIAAAKKDLLQKCIQETSARLKEITALNTDLLNEQQAAALKLYQNHIKQNEIIRRDLEKAKSFLEQQQENVQKRMLNLSQEGITKLSSNFLISFGYLAILAAGLIFSVFTLKTLFGSDDAFSFLADGLLQRAGAMKADTFTRILQLGSVLGIVALFSIICRALVIHIKKRNLPGARPDVDDHQLSLRIKQDLFHYSGKIRSGSWTQFLLRILPLLFITGILIILMSGNRISEELSTSMTGLLIGSCIAAAISGAMYVYVVKVIEPRFAETNAPKNLFKRVVNHWEIITTLLLFSVCLLTIIYRSDTFVYNNGELSKATYIFLSLLLFLAVVFIGAFAISYGILYKSISSLDEELRQKIHTYTAYIDQYSGPYRIPENEYFSKISENVMKQLMEHLWKKNNRMFNNNVITQRTASYFEKYTEEENNEPGTKKKELAERIMGAIEFLFVNLGRLLGLLGDLVLKLLLPPEKDPVQKQTTISFLERKYYLRWEKEYFADLSGKLDAYFTEIDEVKTEIKFKLGECQRLENAEVFPLKNISQSVENSREEINKYMAEISYIEHCEMEGIAEVKKKYEKAKTQLLQGYQLGECLVENKLKPDPSFTYYDYVAESLAKPTNGNGHKTN